MSSTDASLSSMREIDFLVHFKKDIQAIKAEMVCHLSSKYK